MKVSETSCYNECEALTQGLTLSNSSLGEKNRMVKKPPANEGDIRDTSSIPGSGRPPGGGNSNYCLARIIPGTEEPGKL